ncbi:tetratricopeptide repeat protein [Propioniciclava soli]|uniref:tetratricopeptide repeat protein n=1 Tax=Propioniciclava soli TaxID=2775081 RepID=UPI001E364E63
MSDTYERDLEKAQELIALKRDAQAMELLIRLLGEHPDAAAPVHLLLASAHASAGRRQEAIEAARSAVQEEPAWPAALFMLGSTLREAGRGREALPYLEAAAEADPAWSDPHQQRAQSLIDLRRGKEALAAAQQGLNLAPDDPDAHFSYGYVLHEQNPAAAAEAYRAALELDPQHIEALNNLSSLSLQRGNWDEGVRGMANVLAGAPQARLPLTVLDQALTTAVQRVHLLTFGALWVLGAVSSLFLRDAGSPWLAVVLLAVAFAALLAWAVSILRKRLRPIRQQFPHQGERYLRQYARRDPLGAAWAALLLLVWIGLGVGLVMSVILAVGGLSGSGTPPSLVAVTAGFLLLFAAVVVSWVRVPLVKRRLRRQQFLE